jgi:hypothetical protein
MPIILVVLEGKNQEDHSSRTAQAKKKKTFFPLSKIANIKKAWWRGSSDRASAY